MENLKLDLDNLSQQELRSYQELFISTVGKLKNGLFNAEAALGLRDSIDILTSFNFQIAQRIRDIKECLEDIPVTTDIIEEKDI